MKIEKSAYESLVEYEGKELANIAKMVSSNLKEARETLESIINHALKQLYAVR
jgi:hypothetical protein